MIYIKPYNYFHDFNILIKIRNVARRRIVRRLTLIIPFLEVKGQILTKDWSSSSLF